MKHLIPTLLALVFLFSNIGSVGAASSAEPAPLLPESLAARAEMVANQKTITIFIKEEKPEVATELLNNSNDEYAKKGWSVFSILPFVEDGDFEGFFITYEKTLIIN